MINRANKDHEYLAIHSGISAINGNIFTTWLILSFFVKPSEAKLPNGLFCFCFSCSLWRKEGLRGKVGQVSYFPICSVEHCQHVLCSPSLHKAVTGAFPHFISVYPAVFVSTHTQAVISSAFPWHRCCREEHNPAGAQVLGRTSLWTGPG